MSARGEFVGVPGAIGSVDGRDRYPSAVDPCQEFDRYHDTLETRHFCFREREEEKVNKLYILASKREH